jgi:hypothetical protein
MKRQALTIAVTAIFLTTSCKESKKQELIQNETNENLKIENEQTYLYTNNGDTTILTLKNIDNTISGKLSFLAYEKDKRIGVIVNGQMKGDTLFAIYNSMQEGYESECEIAFLKKDDSYILSNDIFGEDNYQYNADYTKGSFKNRNTIKFDGEKLKKITNK